MPDKLCIRCNKIKNITDFYKRPKNICIECKVAYAKEYYEKNKNSPEFIERNRDTKKRYYDNNKEESLKKTKKYYRKNKQKYSEYHKQYERQYRGRRKELRKDRKRKLTTAQKIRNAISKAILKYLKNKNLIKGGRSILNYLPYSLSELKKHLESQFESWMNWNNWGVYTIKTWKDDDCSTWTWQIDHIIPHSKFNYNSMEDEEFKKCWELTNLRPLSAKKNLMKGDR